MPNTTRLASSQIHCRYQTSFAPSEKVFGDWRKLSFIYKADIVRVIGKDVIEHAFGQLRNIFPLVVVLSSRRTEFETYRFDKDFFGILEIYNGYADVLPSIQDVELSKPGRRSTAKPEDHCSVSRHRASLGSMTKWRFGDFSTKVLDCVTELADSSHRGSPW
jgi:hypothetical protein